MSVSDAAVVRRVLTEYWGLGPELALEPLEGGFQGVVWRVEAGARLHVAKCVPAREAEAFAAGLRAAGRVQAGGVPAGAPVPAADGEPVVVAGDGAFALLEYVAGRALRERDVRDAEVLGRTLAAAHLALGAEPARERLEPAIDPSWLALGVRGWIRPAIARAQAAVDELDAAGLTWGVLHGDPAPEAFLYDASAGVCGLIDWGASSVGPRVFDLASAVMYVHDDAAADALVAAYLEAGAAGAREVERALGAMLGWRWAHQAAYFAWRVASGAVREGAGAAAGAAENEKGLADARRFLAPAQVQAYQGADEAAWLRCRVAAFLDTAYFDAVEAVKPVASDADAVIELVAVDEERGAPDRIVGLLDVAVRGELATIETVAVLPEYRGQGLAARLLAEAERRLAGTGARVLDAWTREDAPALAWYARSGFTEEYTYLHVYTPYAGAKEMAPPSGPYRPVLVFAHAKREDEERVRAEYERVYVCRRLVKGLRASIR